MTARLSLALGIELLGLIGWAVAGLPGAGTGIAVGVLLLIVPYYGLSAAEWVGICLRLRSTVGPDDPVTVVNDRCGGGVRYQDGFAVVAVQVLGKARSPARLAGASAPETDDTIDLCDLYRLMSQPLGLRLTSIDVITIGARRLPTGDYARVYDTLIGSPPYAGQRDTWLVIRLNTLANSSALWRRPSIGTSAVATAQRIASTLRYKGIRAKVATVGDITELEQRLGRPTSGAGRPGWRSVRATPSANNGGFLSTYGYRPVDITSDTLAQAWSLRVDDLVQRITLYPDRTISAIITVRTSQPLLTSPSVVLQTLPGEQAQAIAGHLGAAPQRLHKVRRGIAPPALVVPIGASGVLVGRNARGERLLLPFGDSVDFAWIEIAAEDAIAKRLIIRAAATGLRITVHTQDLRRWESIRMPNISITDRSKPVAGSTVSVVDGSVIPAPRPNTVIAVSATAARTRPTAAVSITQTAPRTVRVETSHGTEEVEVDLFRAENRYIGGGPVLVAAAADRCAEW
jgi:type VII secretion protein EccE